MQGHRLLLAAVMVFILARAASAVELPPALKMGELELALNGTGAREQYFLDMYVAGLYLAERSGDAAAIVEADAPMVIRIAITSQFVSQKKLVTSLEEGFEASTGGRLDSIASEIQQFRQCFADEIQRGDVFDLVYAPGHGVIVAKNGKTKGTVAGLEFKRALFGIWLSERPVDADLKQALLGGDRAPRR